VTNYWKPPKQVRELLSQFPGWQAVITNGNHVRLTGPAGEIVHTSFTPSDWRWSRKAASEMRRVSRRVMGSR
jgi:hypothetical protein